MRTHKHINTYLVESDGDPLPKERRALHIIHSCVSAGDVLVLNLGRGSLVEIHVKLPDGAILGHVIVDVLFVQLVVQVEQLHDVAHSSGLCMLIRRRRRRRWEHTSSSSHQRTKVGMGRLRGSTQYAPCSLCNER